MKQKDVKGQLTHGVLDIVCELNPNTTTKKTLEERVEYLEEALKRSIAISSYDHLKVDARATALIVAVAVEAFTIATLFIFR